MKNSRMALLLLSEKRRDLLCRRPYAAAKKNSEFISQTNKYIACDHTNLLFLTSPKRLQSQ